MTPQQHSHMVVRAQSEAAAKGRILRYTEAQSKALEKYYIAGAGDVRPVKQNFSPVQKHEEMHEKTKVNLRKILSALKRHETLTSEDVHNRLGFTKYTSRRLLNMCVDSGTVTRERICVGSVGQYHYKLA